MDSSNITVIVILLITAVLLIIDIVRIDVVALLCLLALGWSGVLEPLETLSGFSSNAVITMIAVMIMGRGIARTGLMTRYATMVLRYAGSRRSRIVAVISGSAGLLSGFIQNIGAAVLFLPSLLNISRRKKIPASYLIMPIGFAIILSGSLTMIGSGPLMLVNDFLAKSSLEPLKLFAVTPVGLALLATCIVFFLLFGRYVLPNRTADDTSDIVQKRIIENWQLPSSVRYYRVSGGSSLEGKTIQETGLWDDYRLNILAISSKAGLDYAPWRETKFDSGQAIALLGDETEANRFADTYGLTPARKPAGMPVFDDTADAGFAEIIVAPRSVIAGQPLKDFGFRRHYGIEPIVLYHKGERVQGDFSDIKITAGDILIVHGLWEKIAELKKGFDFTVVTPFETEEKKTSKAWLALSCFGLAVILAVAGFSIPLSFLSGALLMILTGVVRIDEAYRAIDWKVVFFLAGLIPLGLAMQKTGTAALLAESVLGLVQGGHLFLILLAISAITTVFSLFMSNIGAAVILYPIVIGMAASLGIDARPLALLVAVSTANSFLLPTHQVNALLKTPGGYKNKDYLKAGGGLTALFLIVVTTIFYFFYL